MESITTKGVQMLNETQSEKITKALLVFVMDRKIRNWLKANDPKALEQAFGALDAIHSKAREYYENE